MSDIETAVQDRVGLVTINRPDRGNSVTPRVVSDFGDAVRQLTARDDVDALVLTGAGSVFCAGADVQEMHAVYTADGADGLMAYLAEVWMPAVQTTVRSIWACPKPVVAAFNGAATAGGLDFALACDHRIAVSAARFAESYVNLGMVPVAGGAFLLPLVVGLPAAAELLATGRFLDSAEALRLGLVNGVCEHPGQLPAQAREVALRLARGGTATFARTKQVVRAPYDAGFDSALRASYAANVDLIATEPVRRRIVEVMERYTPR